MKIGWKDALSVLFLIVVFVGGVIYLYKEYTRDPKIDLAYRLIGQNSKVYEARMERLYQTILPSDLIKTDPSKRLMDCCSQPPLRGFSKIHVYEGRIAMIWVYFDSDDVGRHVFVAWP